MADLFTYALGAFLIVFFVIRSAKNKKKQAENQRLGQDFLASNGALDDVEVTHTGLQYQVLEAGSGETHPRATDRVKVHYHGTLLDGTVFDSSVSRGEPIEFGLGQVIKGWTEGLQLMVEGQKMRLFIPPELGYGNSGAGAIGPGSVLIFDVELLTITEL